MDTIKQILLQALDGYTGEGMGNTAYLLKDKTEHLFVVLAVGTFNGKQISSTGIIVRLVDNLVIIEQDITNKPLVDTLVQAGIPRDAIVLAYAGEELPLTAKVM